MNEITVQGIILLTGPIKEYDRRAVLFTSELGKITAFANGARKPNSPLVGMIHPFSFGAFTLYAGRTSYTIKKAKISNYFTELREDLTLSYYGFYFLELVDYFAKEGLQDKELLKLLYQTLRALGKENISNELIRCIFELKTLSISGLAPDISHYQLHQSTLYTLGYIIESPVVKLYTFQVSDQVLAELKKVLKTLLSYHIDREIKSLELLETLIEE